MQTSTHETAPRRPRRAAPAANRKPVYPELPESGNSLFWLAIYLRHVAEADALNDLHTESIRRRRSRVILNASCGAWLNARDETKKYAEHVLRDGLILFAHPATTVFNEVAA